MRRRGLMAALITGSLSGCLRLSSNGDADQSPTGETPTGVTSTPSATNNDPTTPETEDPSPTPEQATDTPAGDGSISYPLGLSEDGVDSLLADAHLNELVGTAFDLNWSMANLTRGEILLKREYEVEDGSALGKWSFQGPIEMHSSAQGSFWREDLGDVVTYGQDRRAFDLAHITKNQRLRQLIRTGDWAAPTPEERDGETVFRIQADGVDEGKPLANEFEVESIESFGADGLVDENGVIRELTAEYEGQHLSKNRLFKWRFSYGLGSLGQVSVPDPEWLSTAKNQAPDVSASITENDELLEFQHSGGNAILPETNVTLYDRDRRRNWGTGEIVDPLSAGTTVYFWMENDQLRWQRNERPTGVSAQPLDGRYGFWMHRAGAEYFGNIEL